MVLRGVQRGVRVVSGGFWNTTEGLRGVPGGLMGDPVDSWEYQELSGAFKVFRATSNYCVKLQSSLFGNFSFIERNRGVSKGINGVSEYSMGYQPRSRQLRIEPLTSIQGVKRPVPRIG